MKYTTLCNSYDDGGGLRNVDISTRLISLQYFWIKKQYDDTTPSWKAIKLHLIK